MYKNDYPPDYNETHEAELTTRQIFMQYILPNKLLWSIALANVFIYLLRYGILDWSPTYLKEVKHFTLDKSSWAYFFYEYAGIPGTLLCGWMSDKVFRGNRGLTGVFFMVLVTVATVVYWLNPPGNPAIDMACMVVIGFLIYGPVMLIGLHALELTPKKPPEPLPVLPGYLVTWAGLLPPVPSSVIPSTFLAGMAVLLS